MSDNGSATMKRNNQRDLSASEQNHMEQLRIVREAEQGLCGVLMRYPDAWREVEGTIASDQFCCARSRPTFRAIEHLAANNLPVNVYTVGQELQRKEMLLEVGGAPWLLTLFDNAMTGVVATQFVATIVEHHRLAAMMFAFEKLAAKARDGKHESADILAEAEKELTALNNKSSRNDATPIAEILNRTLQVIADRRTQGGDSQFIKSGFDDLDAQTGGFRKGDLAIIAGRPSMGKTAFGMNVAERAAENGTKCLIVSIEMSDEQLGERMLSGATGIASEFLRSGKLGQERFDELTAAACTIGATSIQVADVKTVSISAIASLCRRLVLRGGLDLVVIDYLQLVSSENRNMPRHEQVAEFSRRLKLLAVELKIAVIVLCQLNRGPEAREGGIPRISDLRESGACEQDADTIMLVHRPEYYRRLDRPGEADIIIGKQRNGPVGVVSLVFRKEVTRFENAPSQFQTAEQVAAEYGGGVFQ